MEWTRKSQITATLFVAGIVLLLGLAAAAIVFGLRTVESNERLNRLHRQYELAHGILQGLVDAETGVRGYLITGDPSYLEPYYAGLEHTERLSAEAVVESDSMLFGSLSSAKKDLASLILQRQKVMENLIEIAHEKGIATAQAVLAQGQGKRITDEIRREMVLIDQQIAESSSIIAAEVEFGAQFLSGLLSGSIGLAILMSSAQFWLFRREIRNRGTAEMELQSQHRQMAHLSRMADSLHASHSREESYQVIEAFARDVLAGTQGCLYVYNHSRDQVVRAAVWGLENATAAAPWPEHFQPDDCWGLRRGKPHFGHVAGSHIECGHATRQGDQPYLCLPITARGQSSGLLYLEAPGLAGDGDIAERAGNFADQLSLALVNIELRERLQNMAIRDPLTELYNRRFMDEALARELLIAQRNRTSLCLAMMDIDHFKKFNDTYGHPAGDEVLKQVARFLTGYVRRSDFVCRYGGEELMVLLPSCDLGEGRRKANEIRDGIRALSLVAGGEQLPSITVSIGVAAYPQHGMIPAEIIATADQALYEAKRGGRDRVVAAASAEAAK